MNELDSLRQEAETLKNAIRVSTFTILWLIYGANFFSVVGHQNNFKLFSRDKYLMIDNFLVGIIMCLF